MFKCHLMIGTSIFFLVSNLGVCTVWSARFFLKFVIELIGIGFFIIKTDAYRLGSVFRLIVVRFLAIGLIGLVGLKY